MLKKLCATIVIQKKICAAKPTFIKSLRRSNDSTASAWFILFLAACAKMFEVLDLYLPKLSAQLWIFTVIHRFHKESCCEGVQVLRFPFYSQFSVDPILSKVSTPVNHTRDTAATELALSSCQAHVLVLHPHNWKEDQVPPQRKLSLSFMIVSFVPDHPGRQRQ